MSQDFNARTVAGSTGSGPGRIRVRLPGCEPFEVELRPEAMVVGRGQDADLVLDETSVSRRHAALEIAGGKLRVRDLGSANGIELAGKRVTVADLAPGQTVRLGEVDLTLLRLDSATASAKSGFLPSQATQVQAGAGARPAGSGKAKRLAIIGGVSAAAVVILIVLVSLLGGGKSGPSSDPAAAKPVAAQPAAPPSPPPGVAPTQPAVPTAPAASPGEAQRRLQDGQTFYEAGRLPDAAQEWRKALDLDPGLEAARLRLARVDEEIFQQAEESFRVGLQSFNYLNYEAAIQHWQRVLNLVQDPKHPLHQKTVEYIAQARAKLGR